jgi:hypothetical protein
MAELVREGRYDRMTDTMRELTGKAPVNMRDFVKLHAAEFNHPAADHAPLTFHSSAVPPDDRQSLNPN